MNPTYLIALGSNKRHQSEGSPRLVIAAALEALAEQGVVIRAASRVIETAPLGPSARRYANAAALVETRREPEEMLVLVKDMERSFGRRSGGQRWGARVLDVDLVLWSGGIWRSRGLEIPHPQFRKRGFVLGPARKIAGGWRDPISGLTVAQLHARLTRPRPIPR